MQKRLSLHLFPAAAEEGSPEGGSPLAPAAEAASPARGGSPEGSALWRPLRRRTRMHPFFGEVLESAS